MSTLKKIARCVEHNAWCKKQPPWNNTIKTSDPAQKDTRPIQWRMLTILIINWSPFVLQNSNSTISQTKKSLSTRFTALPCFGVRNCIHKEPKDISGDQTQKHSTKSSRYRPVWLTSFWWKVDRPQIYFMHFFFHKR